MLVIALRTDAFSGLKSIKYFGPPTFRFGPHTLNALAPALTQEDILKREFDFKYA